MPKGKKSTTVHLQHDCKNDCDGDHLLTITHCPADECPWVTCEVCGHSVMPRKDAS